MCSFVLILPFVLILSSTLTLLSMVYTSLWFMALVRAVSHTSAAIFSAKLNQVHITVLATLNEALGVSHLDTRLNSAYTACSLAFILVLIHSVVLSVLQKTQICLHLIFMVFTHCFASPPSYSFSLPFPQPI